MSESRNGSLWGLLVLGLMGWVSFMLSLTVPGTKEKNNRQCRQVLKCLDEGVQREQCDVLFPGCEP